jgi:hypothetical protein
MVAMSTMMFDHNDEFFEADEDVADSLDEGSFDDKREMVDRDNKTHKPLEIWNDILLVHVYLHS